MIGEYDITDPRILPCEYCDQLAAGRVMVELYGGSLMLCQSCFELFHSTRSKPYSKVMDKFALRSSGYYINRKMARMGR